MTRTTVGILRGGTGSEYNLSLRTGSAMMSALPEDTYEVRDILIDKSGMWHHRGQPSTPARALAQTDVVLNAIHGGIGEDGTVQRILERAGVAYGGSRPLQSVLSLNKIRARAILQKAGLRMPRAVTFSVHNGLDTGEMATAVFSRFSPPYVVKPPSEGASRGVIVADTIAHLPDAIGDVIDAYGSALIEEFIMGEEASVGVIEQFRNEEHYVLPPAHVHKECRHIHNAHHEEGVLMHTVPSNFSYAQKLSLADMAKLAHTSLGLSHYSRSDLIVTGHGIYLLEVNSVPGLYPSASFPIMLDSVGSSLREFLEHVIRLARS